MTSGYTRDLRRVPAKIALAVPGTPLLPLTFQIVFQIDSETVQVPSTRHHTMKSNAKP